MAGYRLTPWVFWNQLSDTTIDGNSDENKFNNCGPESVAMCLWYLTGVSLTADYIKDTVAGQGATGYTNWTELQGFIQNQANIPTKLYTGDANTQLKPVVQAALAAGHPIIVLFFWDVVAKTGGHFCPITACDDEFVWRANPWGGVEEKWAWAYFEENQQYGNALELLAVRNVPAGASTSTPPATVTNAPLAYLMTVDQALRLTPALDAARGPLVTKGTRVKALPASLLAPHWRYGQIPTGEKGWLLVGNFTNQFS